MAKCSGEYRVSTESAPTSTKIPNSQIPIKDFTLTAHGELVRERIDMFREKVKTVGISVIGPGEGSFDVRIKEINLCSTLSFSLLCGM